MSVGEVFFYSALIFGFFFLVSATKYYSSVLLVMFGSKSTKNNDNKNKNDRNGRREKVFEYFLRSQSQDRNDENGNPTIKNVGDPFVSIHLPFFNEKNVAGRIIDACTNIQYSNFEIVVVDDSSDETLDILKEYGGKRRKPPIKILHRNDRRGFKGGALAEALEIMDPRTEYVMVFDADFIPPPDIINQFLQYFDYYEEEHNSIFEAQDKSNPIEREEQGGSFRNSTLIELQKTQKGKVAVVQGYQLHFLNKSENWITRGVRTEFSGSYMIERVAEEFSGAMKMISGSVFMLRADVAREFGWSTSITEDWELTLRLYQAGFKVVYTPLIQAPAEIPTTLRRLIRQRMRWAEGHTFCVKKQFLKTLNSKMNFREKMEFLYFAPYYLQSFFLLFGTVCWTTSILLKCNPPFWTALLGWGLLLINFLALPTMNVSGLYLERSISEDYKGILSFIALSYIVAPFQAYAAFKGLIEKEEGTWFRTPKTGRITDRVLKIKFRRLVRWVLPRGRVKVKKPSNMAFQSPYLHLIFAALMCYKTIRMIIRLIQSFLESKLILMELRLLNPQILVGVGLSHNPRNRGSLENFVVST